MLSIFNNNERYLLYPTPFGPAMPTKNLLSTMVIAYDTLNVRERDDNSGKGNGNKPDTSKVKIPKFKNSVKRECGKLAGDVKGKVALISFSRKCDPSQVCFNAQKLGAQVVILIHETNRKDSVFLPRKGKYDYADSIKIPCYTIRSEIGEK
ncbi:MAG: hypothetical protein HC817_05965 [Saprospiraceae bacterium]|nr:hypothetical protein [Saprospiraceae bacterium]